MKVFGIEATVGEFKEIAPYVSVNIIIIVLVLFVLWSSRENVLKIIKKIIQHLLKEKPLDKKIKCINCKKKMFSFTYQNISSILRPSIATMTGFYDHRSAGDFLICINCRKVVGIWKSDNTIDQYKITERDSWNNLLKKHRICFLAYTMHDEWIRELNNDFVFCCITQLPTYEMEYHITRSGSLKNRLNLNPQIVIREDVKV